MKTTNGELEEEPNLSGSSSQVFPIQPRKDILNELRAIVYLLILEFRISEMEGQ